MSCTIVIGRIDVAGFVTWIENVSRLLPLLSALRLLRSLCLLRRCLLTFRHCALQVRDGAIENVPSRIDMHGIPITPECKKQRLHLTKRVLAHVIACIERYRAHRADAERIVDQATQRLATRAHRCHSTCIDKIRTIRSSHACDSNCNASRSPLSVAQFQRLPCQACCRASGQIFFLGMMQKRVGRRRFGSQIARIGGGDSRCGDIGEDILRLERSSEADMHHRDRVFLETMRNPLRMIRDVRLARTRYARQSHVALPQNGTTFAANAPHRRRSTFKRNKRRP
jgi:hypothetical protein